MPISLAALELEWSTTRGPAERFEQEMRARGFVKDGGRKWIAAATFTDAGAAARAVRSAAAASKVSIRAIAFGECKDARGLKR